MDIPFLLDVLLDVLLDTAYGAVVRLYMGYSLIFVASVTLDTVPGAILPVTRRQLLLLNDRAHLYSFDVIMSQLRKRLADMASLPVCVLLCPVAVLPTRLYRYHCDQASFVMKRCPALGLKGLIV